MTDSETQRQLAEHEANVKARYAKAGAITKRELDRRAAADRERRRKDRWLLVDADGQIVGVMARHVCETAVEAFEDFYPRKRERAAAAKAGYHIEQDDAQGTRFETWAAAATAGNARR